MTISLPISMFVRGAIVLALALLAVRLARRAPASMRHAVLATALAAVLVLPVVAMLVPTWHAGAFAPAPVDVIERPALPVAEHTANAAVGATRVAPSVPAPASIPWGAMFAALWLAGVGIGIARIAVGSIHARRIASRALRATHELDRQPLTCRGIFAMSDGVDARTARRTLDGRGDPLTSDGVDVHVRAAWRELDGRGDLAVSDGVDAYGRAARRVRGKPPRVAVNEGVDAHVRAAWRALDGHGEPPRVVVSDEVEAPIVVGAIAPVVVVPLASATWGTERWRVVLLHELAHVRRRDGFANLVARLAACVHWIDPLAWIAMARLRAERELAADDAVLRDGTRASTYAEHLVAIASAAQRRPPAAVLAMAAPSRFEARLVALLDRDRSRGTIGGLRKLALAASVALVGVAAACVSPEAAPSAVAPASGTPALAAKDPALQAAAEAELDRAMTAHHATGAIAIVLDAKTGAPLVLATRGDGDPRAARAPGSTFKPFVFAAALEAGVVDATTSVDCENGVKTYGARQLHDASPHGILDLGAVLAVSSNVCTAKIAEPLGDRLGEALRRYHFAAPGRIDTHSLDGASIAAGEGVHTSALELATGYTAFADDGVYHAADGSSGDAGERVMSAPTARAMMAMLARVVDDPIGTGHAARIDGVRVAGKTGTAHSGSEDHYYASFVGIVPADAPRFVVLVGFDGVTGSGGEVAAPVFAAIAAKALGR